MNRTHDRLVAVLLAIACGTVAAADHACEPANGFTPLCGFERPEDLEVVAGGRALLVSEYGALTGARTGRLLLYRPDDGSRRVLWPAAGTDAGGGAGAADCPGPPGAEFSPHGIHHATGSDRVAVVNHGGREAVELFAVIDGDDADSFALAWRGCVPAPEGVWMNDVVNLPGGGLAVTHMVAKGTAEEALFESERRRDDIGYVLEWSAAGGWRQLPNTGGGLPNGIEVSADGATLYVNEYFGDRVYAYDRASATRLWSTAVDGPDNSGWSADGRLLVASHHEDLHAVFTCNEAPLTYCPLRYAIVAIDPANGHRVTVVEGGGEPFGAATVAVELGGALYLGSFVGDRMAVTTRGNGVRP